VGEKPHRYVFTIFALKVEKLQVPSNASGALVGFMVRQNAIGKASLTGYYGRANQYRVHRLTVPIEVDSL
jgi:hypothetical protein